MTRRAAGPYNGHKNWNHWNVSLWLNNDETLYAEMLTSIRYTPNRQSAAKAMFQKLRLNHITKTPDDAPYSVSAIRAAMVGVK